MKLPSLENIDVKDKKVLVRVDIDVPFDKDGEEYKVRDDSRIKGFVPTLKKLFEMGARQVILLGHIGKYEGEDKTVSTEFLAPVISQVLGQKVEFVKGMPPEKVGSGRVVLLDNVRLDPGEEENNGEFTKKLSALGDVYVNESFATSHRSHASIVGIPKVLPHAAGIRLQAEIDKLDGILENPRKPVIAIISGVKKDKLNYIENFKKIADRVLVGGRLPEYLGDDYSDSKVVVARLLPDKEDITLHSVEIFEEEIKKAGTIILAGVPGKYEEEGHRQGTRRVFEAIGKSSAFKIVGGGDSEAALSLLGLTSKFDWISSGGGAMLEYLTKGTLPGIEVLKD